MAMRKTPQTYERLQRELTRIEGERATSGNRLFYLATPPAAIRADRLPARRGRAWRARRTALGAASSSRSRSAPTSLPRKALNRKLLEALSENQIYRIDHYLGKETVQNIMVLRFANGLFEPIWNRDHIDHVQITVAETAHRGAPRPLLRRHRGVARHGAEPSLSAAVARGHGAAGAFRGRRGARGEGGSARCDPGAQRGGRAAQFACAAQYRAGYVANEAVEDYRRSKDVNPHSTTETYVALKLMIDNWRWAGVPFYLRTGKALALAIAPRSRSSSSRRRSRCFATRRSIGWRRISSCSGFSPTNASRLQVQCQGAGSRDRASTGVGMTFRYADYFDAAPSTGYETLIYDCMIGDAILFQRADGIEAGWRVVQPVPRCLAQTRARKDLQTYAAGSEGPPAADELLARDGRRWRAIE